MEALDHALSQVVRGSQPLELAGGRVQFHEAEPDLRMVGQIPFVAQRAVAPGVVHPPSRTIAASRKRARSRAASHEVVAPEQPAGFGERAQRHAVPVGQHLVVGDRPDALRTRGVQALAYRAFPCGEGLRSMPSAARTAFRIAPLEHVDAVLPVARSVTPYRRAAAWASAPSTARNSAQRPDVELAFDALGVGVLRGAERSRRGGRVHLAQQVCQACPRRRSAAARRRSAGTRRRRRARAARCRTASSRNAARASARRSSSARSRRRRGRTCRRRPCAQRRGEHRARALVAARRPAPAGTAAAATAETSAPRRSRRALRRSAARAARPLDRAGRSAGGAARAACRCARCSQQRLGLPLDLGAPVHPRVAHGGQHLGEARHAWRGRGGK